MILASTYLVGVKHTGKSTLGRALAGKLKRPFFDTDRLVQQVDQADTGMRRSIRSIYAEDGAERFRRLEATACQLVAERDDGPIVATGGGICDNPEALRNVTHGFVIHLRDEIDRVVERIMRNGIPAFLHSSDNLDARVELAGLLERRVRLYEEIAEVTVDVSTTPSEGFRRLMTVVEEHVIGRK